MTRMFRCEREMAGQNDTDLLSVQPQTDQKFALQGLRGQTRSNQGCKGRHHRHTRPRKETNRSYLFGSIPVVSHVEFHLRGRDVGMRKVCFAQASARRLGWREPPWSK